jgi:O-acetyl-ADP-ribose deacetylase (regulator of RNase III)
MIVYRTGDVVEAFKKGEIDILVHGCNACGVMGSGIAKQIKEEFPLAYGQYKEQERVSGLVLGNFSVWYDHETSRRIINLITQDKYLPRDQRHFSYDYFDNALQIFNLCYKNQKIGMPAIGAGLGGGNWKVIEAIINSRFPDREIYVYELKADTLEEPARKNGRNDFA